MAQHHPQLASVKGGWVNRGPASLAEFGLPEGYGQRLQQVCFGTKVVLRLLGRKDLLALKLWAAADDKGSRQEIHFKDLKDLHPKFDELDWAVEWTRGLPDFEEKRLVLKDVLGRLGYDDLAYYV